MTPPVLSPDGLGWVLTSRVSGDGSRKTEARSVDVELVWKSGQAGCPPGGEI